MLPTAPWRLLRVGVAPRSGRESRRWGFEIGVVNCLIAHGRRALPAQVHSESASLACLAPPPRLPRLYCLRDATR